MATQTRYEMVLPQWLKEAAQREAEKKGISLARYIKDLIKRDVERRSRPTSLPEGRSSERDFGKGAEETIPPLLKGG